MFSAHKATVEHELQFRKAAASNNVSECVRLLRDHAVNINSFGLDSGKTALHWAAEKEHLEIVQFLLDQGALLKSDKNGFTAYDLTDSPQISRLLSYHFMSYFQNNDVKNKYPISEAEAIQYGFTISQRVTDQILDATKGNSLVTFQNLLDKYKLTVNSFVDGMPLMLHSAVFLSADFIDFYIGRGVNLNLTAHRIQRDAYQGTVLHGLLANEFITYAMIILNKAKENGLFIDATIRDVEGKTIVLMGVLLRDTVFVSTCLAELNGAAINIPDKQGRTPLHFAYLFGHKDMINILKEHGADLECVDIYGKKPLDMLHENASVIISAFEKFHINARTRIIGPRQTLLSKCIEDRIKILKECPSDSPALTSLST